MLAATRSSWATFLVLVFCLMGSSPTYAQNTNSFTASKTANSRLSRGVLLSQCETLPVNLLAAWRLSIRTESPMVTDGIADDSNAASPPNGACPEAAPAAPPRRVLDSPCPKGAAGTLGVPSNLGCGEPQDIVPAELTGFGKAGLKISRAREAVLEILRSQNACTDWFETKDANPAATFQSLRFVLDQSGPQDIFELPQVESLVFLRQPYVARATQDGGAYTTITLNVHGAFFRPQGHVQKLAREGGPPELEGTHLLTVGSYGGDKLPAQMVTLLHELGHIIDLLPEDADNLDGKSVRNTDEVLRHCRADIEARGQSKQTAKR